MSGERINLGRLRRLAVNHGVFVASDGHNSATMADWDDVLALVEAVEQAQEFLDALRWNDDPGRGELKDALARFEFGGGV